MRYTHSHEWVALDDEIATIGITDYAQKELGEIVYIELPKKGFVVKAGEEVVVLESTKAAIDIYSPLSGEIIQTNASLIESPDKLNESAEDGGWLFKLKMHNPQEAEKFMLPSSYKIFIAS